MALGLALVEIQVCEGTPFLDLLAYVRLYLNVAVTKRLQYKGQWHLVMR